jgi:hypothetical protein
MQKQYFAEPKKKIKEYCTVKSLKKLSALLSLEDDHI